MIGTRPFSLTASTARASASATRTGRISRTSSARPALRRALSSGGAGSSRISAYSARNSRRAAVRSWRVPRSSAVPPSVSRSGLGELLERAARMLDAVAVGEDARGRRREEQHHGQRVAIEPADRRGDRHQTERRPHGPRHERMPARRAPGVGRSHFALYRSRERRDLVPRGGVAQSRGRKPSAASTLAAASCSAAFFVSRCRRRAPRRRSSRRRRTCDRAPARRRTPPNTAPGAAAGQCLLQLGLRVDMSGAGVLDPRLERLDDRPRHLLEADFEVDGNDRRLQQRGKHVAAAGDPLQLALCHVLCLRGEGACPGRAPSPPRRSSGGRRRARGSSPAAPRWRRESGRRERVRRPARARCPRGTRVARTTTPDRSPRRGLNT